MHIVYYLSLLVLRTIDLLYCRSQVTGKENIPRRGGCILACNHISNLDPFIIGTTTWRYLNFMAKEELFRNHFLSWYWHQVGAFPIKRGDADFRAIREAIRRLKMGRLLVMFPEGTRGAADRVKKINPGIGLLVKSAGVPVIPVHIKGTDGALPNSAKWLTCHPVSIHLGKPLFFDKDLSNIEIAESIMDKIRDGGNLNKPVSP